MKGRMILADAATVHPDGTFSMLRAGIGGVQGPSLPMPFDGTLVIQIVGELGDHGPHVFDLRCLTMDGKPAIPPLKGSFDIPQGGGNANLLLGIQVVFREAGRLIWCLRIDQHIADELPFLVQKAEQPPATPAMPAKGGE